MASFLESIGYNSWVLPALLIIPLIGAVALLALPARDQGSGDGVEKLLAEVTSELTHVIRVAV